MTVNDDAPGDLVRGLLRRAETAALATRLAAGGEPYASLVLLATDAAACPLLLLSDLADHSRNIAADPRVSLLIDGTHGLRDRLTGPRASVQGRADEVADAGLKARFVRRHPSAAMYADFADFRLYRVSVERAHLVAGFGRIAWVEGTEIVYPLDTVRSLVAAEEEIVDHMNADHADAMALIARHLMGLEGDGWKMAGVDPEGFDLCRDGCRARLTFDRAVADPQQCRRELVALTKRARRRGK
ncbi:HugZ family protein [Ferruginivarius sediminum]|uniref:HugZ family pyridoxamine 5'-phosphate oxidase n=1 Tax=Ferruginivarius sediminum TaxID=2661937 RepID=UPI001F4DA9F7|nr:DUF2470 domain-containing protein [Ferruginivarius sediminum]